MNSTGGANNEETVKIYNNLKKLELKSRSAFKMSEDKREKGLNHKRFKEIMEGERDPMVGVFGDKGKGKPLDPHRLDFLQLNYKQHVE